MKLKNLTIAIAACLALSFASASWAPAADDEGFVEAFDKYEIGADILEAGGGLYETVKTYMDKKHGTIVVDPTDADNKMLEHAGDDAFITRIVKGKMPVLGGEVTASIDIEPVAGKHGLYLFNNNNRVLIWFDDSRKLIAISEKDGKGAWARPGGENARWTPGKRYRLTVTVHIDPNDGTKTVYDVDVRNLTDDKPVGSIEGVANPGDISQITHAQILSGADRAGNVEGRFDNWKIAGKVLRPAAKAAPKRKATETAPKPGPRSAVSSKPPFAPATPPDGRGEVVFEPYVGPGVGNLVRNGDIEQGLTAWTKGEDEYTPERAAAFDFRLAEDDAYQGERSLFLGSSSTKHSGYWSQAVPVAGGKTYLVNVWAKMHNGCILVWMAGAYGDNRRFNERIYLLQGTADYLVPIFLSPRYTTALATDDWFLLSRTIDTPATLKVIRFAVGSYFGDGDLWFDNMSVRQLPAEGAPVRVCLRPEGRKVTGVEIFMASTGDQVVKEQLGGGVDSFDKVYPVADMSRETYGLRVTFTDGKTVTTFCPNRDQILRR